MRSATVKILIVNILFFCLFLSCSKKSEPIPPDNPPTPTITSLNVTEGNYNTAVIITGTNFSATASDDHVFFNGKAATVTTATTTELTVTVPQDAGTGAVTVKVGTKTGTGPIFTYLGVLAINSLSVDHGPYNTSVVITGTGFNNAVINNKVFFNGKPATITAATSTQLTATVPLSAGTGNITVSVNDGSPVSGPIFTYQLSAVVTTLAGSAATGASNGKGADASFSVAFGIVVDASGNLFVSDKNNSLIRKVTPDGIVTTVAGNGQFTSVDGIGTAASFAEPLGLTIDATGNLYVDDFGSGLIRKITPVGNVTTIKVDVNNTGTLPDFLTPVGLAFDADGNLYVSDYIEYLIKKLNPSGELITFAGNGQLGQTNGAYNVASFNSPQGIRIDKTGNLYVVDGNTIRKIDNARNVTTFVGAQAAGFADGQGTNAKFNGARDLAIDKDGNIYVTDTKNKLIRKISPDGNVSTVAGNINSTSSIDGIGSAAGFSAPNGICIDSNGNLYITDGNEIRKIVFE